MRLAYADPPYLGQAKKHYKMPEVNQVALIEQLTTYDGWALSLSSPSLRVLLPLCPSNVRVGAWVKPWASFKKGVNPAYAWEPVVFVPARKPSFRDTLRDWLSASATIQKGLSGAKPESFCAWIFQLLGARSEDSLDDIFPGTGIVMRVWELNKHRLHNSTQE